MRRMFCSFSSLTEQQLQLLVQTCIPTNELEWEEHGFGADLLPSSALTCNMHARARQATMSQGHAKTRMVFRKICCARDCEEPYFQMLTSVCTCQQMDL